MAEWKLEARLAETVPKRESRTRQSSGRSQYFAVLRRYFADFLCASYLRDFAHAWYLHHFTDYVDGFDLLTCTI